MKTQRNTFKRIGIAVFSAFLLLSVLILTEAAKIQASAASNALKITDPTFVRIRSGVSSSVPNNFKFFSEANQR